MDQKKIFLNSEGDSWNSRNKGAEIDDKDPIVNYFYDLHKASPGEIFGRLLEIGCADGKRLSVLKALPFTSLEGLEPSKEAVEAAVSKGVHAYVGTADQLPFEDRSFDYVVFAGCLYLVDREDLFSISHEADRVLKPNGKIILYDFSPQANLKNQYKHCSGVVVHKMDHSKMFTWNPDYTVAFRKSYSYDLKSSFSSNLDDQIVITVLNKCMPGSGYIKSNQN